MKKSILFIIGLFCVSSSIKASNLDSVGIRTYKGKTCIVHVVEPKETYYSLGRKYTVPPKDIMGLNDEKPMTINDTIYVYRKGLSNNATVSENKNTANRYTEHTVQSGETMFSISKKYDVTVDEIVSLNNLSTNTLSIGQKLLINSSNIPAVSPVPTTYTEEKKTTTTIQQTTTNYEIKPHANVEEVAMTVGNTSNVTVNQSTGNKEINESGLATSLNDNDLNHAKSVALHRSAPVGTIIKVTNPMTNKSVYVKVVGNFPDNSDTQNVLIIISKSAANLLDARDQRFRVDLSYIL
jgi:LysM repeat protein